MSHFGSVDAAPDPASLIQYLDIAAQAGSRMKHYIAAAHAAYLGDGPVLDLGCGAGHDLAILAGHGVRAMGVDPSATALAAARTRVPDAIVVQANGESLPFRTASLAGCRTERVLMHVADPAAVLSEVVRCVRRGGLITIYEPDWSTLRLLDDGQEASVPWLSPARHAAIGGRLQELLEAEGCQVLECVEERSYWHKLAKLDRAVDTTAAVRGAIDDGTLAAADGAAWLSTQRAKDAAGTFGATMVKVLIVAVNP